jgi:hypothetical protein
MKHNLLRKRGPRLDTMFFNKIGHFIYVYFDTVKVCEPNNGVRSRRRH